MKGSVLLERSPQFPFADAYVSAMRIPPWTMLAFAVKKISLSRFSHNRKLSLQPLFCHVHNICLCCVGSERSQRFVLSRVSAASVVGAGLGALV